MQRSVSPVTMLATFDDRISAEIACALLSEGSIHPDEPEAADNGTWLVCVRRVDPDLAGRARVILNSAGARGTTIAGSDQRTAYVFSEPQAPDGIGHQDDMLSTVVPQASSHFLPGSGRNQSGTRAD